MPENPPERLLPLHETALYFSVKDNEVKAWVRRGCPCVSLNGIPPCKRGAVLRFDVAALQRWHESFTKPVCVLQQFSFDFS